MTRTIAIKHSHMMNYERQFCSRFLTGGWYRQMVVTHYHSNVTRVYNRHGRWAIANRKYCMSVLAMYA